MQAITFTKHCKGYALGSGTTGLTFVTSLSIPKSCVQCFRSQPVPRTNLRYGKQRLHAALQLQTTTANIAA